MVFGDEFFHNEHALFTDCLSTVILYTHRHFSFTYYIKVTTGECVEMRCVFNHFFLKYFFFALVDLFIFMLTSLTYD